MRQSTTKSPAFHPIPHLLRLRFPLTQPGHPIFILRRPSCASSSIHAVEKNCKSQSVLFESSEMTGIDGNRALTQKGRQKRNLHPLNRQVTCLGFVQGCRGVAEHFADLERDRVPWSLSLLHIPCLPTISYRPPRTYLTHTRQKACCSCEKFCSFLYPSYHVRVITLRFLAIPNLISTDSLLLISYILPLSISILLTLRGSSTVSMTLFAPHAAQSDHATYTSFATHRLRYT